MNISPTATSFRDLNVRKHNGQFVDIHFVYSTTPEELTTMCQNCQGHTEVSEDGNIVGFVPNFRPIEFIIDVQAPQSEQELINQYCNLPAGEEMAAFIDNMKM